MKFWAFCLSVLAGSTCSILASAIEFRQLTFDSAAVDMEPSWSPDGKWIAFTRFQNRGHAICIISTKDGIVRRLSPANYGYGNPMWSLDSKWVVYISGHKEGNRLWKVSIEGGEPIEFLPRAKYGQCLQPAWSPDRRTIAYLASVPSQIHYTPPKRDIWLLDAASGNSRRLSYLSTASIRHPSWSPDGTEIAFVVRGGHDILKAISVTDGTIREIGTYRIAAHGEKHFESPEWSPDGSAFVVSSGLNPHGVIKAYVVDSTGAEKEVLPTAPDIWIVPAGERDPIQITETVEQEQSPTWSPDGKKIAFVRRSNIGSKERQQHIWTASDLLNFEKSDR